MTCNHHPLITAGFLNKMTQILDDFSIEFVSNLSCRLVCNVRMAGSWIEMISFRHEYVSQKFVYVKRTFKTSLSLNAVGYFASI